MCMLYPFMILDDGTEIVHSETIYYEENKKQVKVVIEKPILFGFKSAVCILPEYRWTNIGFTDEEMKFYQEFVESISHVILRLADEGGFGSDSNF